MSTEKDPFYWETLRDLDNEDLPAVLEKCAADSLLWALDQAANLYYDTPCRRQAEIIVKFCLEKADKAAAIDAGMGLQAWQLASRDEGSNPEHVAKSLRKVLDRIGESDPQHAWELADLALGMTKKDTPAHLEIVGFMAEKGEDPYGLLGKKLTREFSAMTESGLTAIVTQMTKLAAEDPERAVPVLRAVVDANRLRGLMVVEEARQALRQCEGDELPAPVTAGCVTEYVEKPAPEPASAPFKKPCDMHPLPRLVQ